MRGKHKAVYAVLFMILIRTFLPFCLPLDRAADTEQIHRVYEASSHQGYVIHMESDHFYAADCIQPEQKNDCAPLDITDNRCYITNRTKHRHAWRT